jgi:antitoxin ChpS
MMAVPPAFLDMLHIGAGTTVAVEVEHGRLVVQPQLRPRYTLDELLAQCDASVTMSAEDRVWLDSAPVGNELL